MAATGRERCAGCREFGCPFGHIPEAHKPRRTWFRWRRPRTS